ncbi:hypothetical protein VA7868_01467 [Vibrio aerogenes CECT 7868]|uniref:Methyltransferase domain-containing protein n=1 Tax=Vibrio aerogenes CECT 7868 TaxID=1216006 RepID=A0A1M5Y374_9VIBR|nr:class I SAM-dependent methyltransferase [Vibrio aerogenes]SHI06530.1 hypothetical protein VA7868_01467 [Vibrio aerogenes CECT 7868]
MTEHITDYDALSAEMYDILSEAHWQQRQPSFTETLRQMNAPSGNWLNIGTGTGLELSMIAKTIPDIHLFAIEPSAAMRVGLMTRLMMQPEIQHRVTVIADSFQDADLPSSFSAATVCGCIGFFDETDRAALWQRLARNICHDGAILVDTMMVDHPQRVETMKVGSKQIGQQTYEVYLQGEPGSQTMMHWTMTYKVIRNHQVQREFKIERDWRAFGIGQVIDEAAREGFSGEIIPSSPVPTAILRYSS